MKIRFTLRTLLGILTLSAFWLGYHLDTFRRQQIAVEAIEASGGSVRYDYQRSLENSEGQFTPNWLRKIVPDDLFHRVVEVQWYGKSSFSAAELSNLKALPSLDAIYFVSSGIDDKDLKAIRGVRKLRTLWLVQCDSVTDLGLADIARLCNLEELAISGTSCTDPGIKLRIPSLTKLHYLDVGGIVENNDTAKVLCQLNDLTFLNLGYVDNSEFDILDVGSYFNARRPHCVVNYNGNRATNEW